MAPSNLIGLSSVALCLLLDLEAELLSWLARLDIAINMR
jgi:hypothetical protein